MAGRYLVTGAQLGTLITLCKVDPERCNEELNLIIENQFVGNSNEAVRKDINKVSKLFK